MLYDHSVAFPLIILTIGGENYTYEKGKPPNHVIDLSCTRYAGGIGQSVVINIFDSTAFAVESKLMKGMLDIKLQYGYSIRELTPVYEMTVTKYDLDFKSTGATLTIEGTAIAQLKIHNPRTREYKQLRIDEIVKQISLEEGWKIGYIEPCKPLLEKGDKDLRENYVTFLQENEKTVDFINDKLIPFAMSAKDGDGDYYFQVYSTENGSKVFFAPRFWSEDRPVYSVNYVIGKENDRVISFKPEFNNVLTGLKGGGIVEGEYVDPYTNEYKMIRVASMDAETDNKIVRRVGASSYSYSQMEALCKNIWYSASNMSYPATLEITGNIELEPQTQIFMTVLTQDGFVHHSSGVYVITSIDDSISGGSFTSTVHMMKNGNGSKEFFLNLGH